MITVSRQIAKIHTIGCIEELDAYEAAAKARGIEADEIYHISAQYERIAGGLK